VTATRKISELEEAGREHELKALLRQAKRLAVEYYTLTGRPLGVTGEVAEYEAAEKLGLTLVGARTPLFDAFREIDGRKESFQIKGRAVSPTARYRGRVPKIKFDGHFDAVLLVLLDKLTFDAIEIWRAERDDVIARLTAPGSRARNERGQMGISQFKSIAGPRPIWRKE
jgi:hypothetical protein